MADLFSNHSRMIAVLVNTESGLMNVSSPVATWITLASPKRCRGADPSKTGLESQPLDAKRLGQGSARPLVEEVRRLTFRSCPTSNNGS